MGGGVCWHVTCALLNYCRQTRAKTRFRVRYRIMGNHRHIWKAGFDVERRVIEERGLKNKVERNVCLSKEEVQRCGLGVSCEPLSYS